MKRLQSLLQWLFLRVEALFNAAFGDQLNPLYHLGAMSFFLFWVVAASGLYLYAFFETGVAQAYASVQALTHGQWYAGGVLRSVHRYASDAMVVTMLVHLLRHFAFDRFHGFRWFSWATGVALVWGVYISGINGYMLPWDRLAQFVIVASFEWLDWLPSFGGTLMRNFIHPGSVGDRLFSLLSFMHIGLPLLVLLMHVGACAARAESPHHASAAHCREPARHAGRALAGPARDEPGWRRRPGHRGDVAAARLVLPAAVPADRPLAAGPGLGPGDGRYGPAGAAAVVAAQVAPPGATRVAGGGARQRRRAHTVAAA